jgi:glutathione peroxidase-family protein
VIGKDGMVKAFFPSKVTPEDPQLRKAIEDALAS